MITLDMHTMEIEDATEAVGDLSDITGLDEFADHPSMLVPCCAGCGRPILDLAAVAHGGFWHEACAPFGCEGA